MQVECRLAEMVEQRPPDLQRPRDVLEADVEREVVGAGVVPERDAGRERRDPNDPVPERRLQARHPFRRGRRRRRGVW